MANEREKLEWNKPERESFPESVEAYKNFELARQAFENEFILAIEESGKRPLGMEVIFAYRNHEMPVFAFKKAGEQKNRADKKVFRF